jgi:hypothetical protein
MKPTCVHLFATTLTGLICLIVFTDDASACLRRRRAHKRCVPISCRVNSSDSGSSITGNSGPKIANSSHLEPTPDQSRELPPLSEVPAGAPELAIPDAVKNLPS